MGYITHAKRLDKETYDRYSKLSKAELRKEAEKIAEDMMYYPCAYGLYSVFLYELDGEYILRFETSDSCD